MFLCQWIFGGGYITLFFYKYGQMYVIHRVYLNYIFLYLFTWYVCVVCLLLFILPSFIILIYVQLDHCFTFYEYHHRV